MKISIAFIEIAIERVIDIRMIYVRFEVENRTLQSPRFQGPRVAATKAAPIGLEQIHCVCPVQWCLEVDSNIFRNTLSRTRFFAKDYPESFHEHARNAFVIH